MEQGGLDSPELQGLKVSRSSSSSSIVVGNGHSPGGNNLPGPFLHDLAQVSADRYSKQLDYAGGLRAVSRVGKGEKIIEIDEK